VITTAEALDEFVTRALECDAVGVDTEFFWERTFAPILGLIQVSLGPDDCYLIDPLALKDLTRFGDLLADKGTVKILHDAQQDLAILQRSCGQEPRNIFDTRLAAGFAGLASTLSLTNLLNELLGVDLEKGEQRSNWLARPLRDSQCVYASADVAHLHQAREILLERIGDNAAWLNEELATLDTPGLYAVETPEAYFKRMRKGRSIPARARAILRECVLWRETEAAHRDRPRSHVLSDDILVAIARAEPKESADLRVVKGFSERAVQRYGRHLLGLVESAVATDPATWPVPDPQAKDYDLLQERTKLALAAIKPRAEEVRVDSALMGARAAIQKVILMGESADPADHRILAGWRAEFLTPAIRELLVGQPAMALAGAGRRRSRMRK